MSWVETSANAYNAYLGKWKPVNGYVFVNGERCNFYGSIVEDIVTRLEGRGITMKPGISTWDDIFTDADMLKTVLSSDATVAALLDDTALRNKAKNDTRIKSAIKNYSVYGRAALTHIKNNATLKSEFIALSAAYSDKTDFKYLLTCESCSSSGSVNVPCSVCRGNAYYETSSGWYFMCSQCGYFDYNPIGWDHCSCGNSIANGNYTLYEACPNCNEDGRRRYGYGAYNAVTCSSCGGKGCHF